MSSAEGSAFVPSSVTVFPLTLTRPCVISSSDSRREATPAADRIFCNLSPTATFYLHRVTDVLTQTTQRPRSNVDKCALRAPHARREYVRGYGDYGDYVPSTAVQKSISRQM